MIKILVVDDELDVCSFLERILSREGYEVIVATSGMQAIEKVKSEKPQLILLDLRMPQMDGVQTLERIRQIDKEVVVMIVTVVNDADIAKKTIKLGAINYLVKPIDVDMLKRSLRGWAAKIEANELSEEDILAFKYNEKEFKAVLGLFQEKGYHIKIIENKNIQLEMAAELFDLVILRADIMRDDTIEVLAKCKAAYPHLPIMIAVGIESSAELVNKIKEYGPCHYLPVYFDTAGLMLIIYKIVSRSHEKRKIKEQEENTDYILIVDDEPDVCEYAARFLDREGYKVSAISDSLAVLDQVEALKPSLVFLDIVMPGVDGLELLKKIKKIHPHTQVVMMTGVKDESVCRESIKAGASNYLVKPFSLDQLKATVVMSESKFHPE